MTEPEKRPWWSVRVSGVLRLLLIIYGVLGLPLLVAYGVSFVSHRWMTQKEKRAAIKALRSVEDLKSSTGIGDNAWKIKDKKAEQLVEGAQEAAFTEKDREIGTGLFAMLGMIEVDHTQAGLADMNEQVAKRFPKAHLSSDETDLQNQAKVQGYVDEMQIMLNSELRSELGLYGPSSKKK